MESLHQEEVVPASVQSVKKAISIVMEIAGEDRPLSLTEVATRTGLPIATASRLLSTLTSEHVLHKEGREYGLGLRAFEIGKRAEGRIDLIGVARPHLTRLASEANESANLAVLSDTEVVYLSCIESERMMRTFTVPGARVPAHATGVGKALLSGLKDSQIRELYQGKSLDKFTPKTLANVDDLLEEVEKSRQTGYSLDEGEKEEGVLCIAAAVRDYSGKIVAAVSVSGPASRMGGHIPKLGRLVLSCAGSVSKDLGWKNASD